ncbi:MAG: translational GTPase TypA, partial [Deltaproteobacteria bacterium]|nr:translational GTPase TypA [Deltaproteobacteria bacterium]
NTEEPLQVLVSDLGYSDYLGRLAIGKIVNGTIKHNEKLICINSQNQHMPLKISKLQVYDGMQYADTKTADAGEIVILSGIEEVTIGDTICYKDFPKALKRISVDEPTVSMVFSPNTSPLVGKEGKLVQSSKIKERLIKETLSNVAIKVELSKTSENFIVKGRGEFQMAILIETMRREGFELCVGRPEVIYKTEKGKKLEPIEKLFVDCEEVFIGIVSEKLSAKKGKMINLVNNGKGRVRIEFSVPSRALIGYRDEFLTDTKGTGIMNSYISGYEPYRGDFPCRFTGSIVADRSGVAVAYALFNLEPRGRLFIVPGYPIYEGMVVGETSKDADIDVNPAKEKKLSNVRASGKDDAVVLTPIRPMTLEDAINFIQEDEMVEVTPKSIRLRKTILSTQKRHQIRGSLKKK